MSVLVLRLAGVQQSWSTYRPNEGFISTERVPSRSALLGLLAACLGAQRGKYPVWLEQTKFLVRVDCRGVVETDYQTVNPFDKRLGEVFWRQEFLGGRVRNENLPENRVAQAVVSLRGVVQKGSAKVGTKNKAAWMNAGKLTSSAMRREFLADAEFVVAVTHPTHLSQLFLAVQNPVFATYLGRKAFVPTFPFVLGLGEDQSALEVLGAIPTAGSRLGSGLSDNILASGDILCSLKVFPLVGDRNVDYEVVEVLRESRKGQLEWLQKNLHR